MRKTSLTPLNPEAVTSGRHLAAEGTRGISDSHSNVCVKTGRQRDRQTSPRKACEGREQVGIEESIETRTKPMKSLEPARTSQAMSPEQGMPGLERKMSPESHKK